MRAKRRKHRATRRNPPYRGHPSRAAWNVALWVGNDEPLYRRAVILKRKHGSKRAAQLLLQELPKKTPDGYKYTQSTLQRAIAGLEK